MKIRASSVLAIAALLARCENKEKALRRSQASPPKNPENIARRGLIPTGVAVNAIYSVSPSVPGKRSRYNHFRRNAEMRPLVAMHVHRVVGKQANGCVPGRGA